MNINELYDNISSVARSQKQPKILRPFVSMDIEDLKEKHLSQMYNIIKDASVMECLFIMSTLYERSHQEFLIMDPQYLLSTKAIQVYLNLSFANKQGIFYTLPMIANFIVAQTISRLLKNCDLTVTGNKENSLASSELLNLRICEPACGSSIFLISFVKRFLDATMATKKSDAAKLYENNRTLSRIILGRIVCGVDTDEMALELSQIELCLLLGFSLEELPDCKNN